MTNEFKSIAILIQFLAQRLAAIVFVLSALALTIASCLAAFGVLPWLEFNASFGGQTYENAGQYAQIGVTVLVLLLCFFLPSNSRILQLETSHRRFAVGMQDVARAYSAAHTADRSGAFQMSSEFDAVRERLAYLREHPDLGDLEPEILELAAQMSHISQELAQVYSDDKISRARAFLTQRQEEVEQFNARLDQAKQVCQDLKHWAHEVELEESVAASQLQRLRDELRTVLPELGVEETLRARPEPRGRVVGLDRKAAE